MFLQFIVSVLFKIIAKVGIFQQFSKQLTRYFRCENNTKVICRPYFVEIMNKTKKTYKIEVDCANCANEMEEAANKTEGVKSAAVNFMTLKMMVEFEDNTDEKEVMKRVLANCKKVEDDCEIYFN